MLRHAHAGTAGPWRLPIVPACITLGLLLMTQAAAAAAALPADATLPTATAPTAAAPTPAAPSAPPHFVDPMWACAMDDEGGNTTARPRPPSKVLPLRPHQLARLLPQTWAGCMRYACPDPDTCTHAHYALAKAVMRALACTHATWLPVYGTLLGLVRNQSLSPNPVHMDVDFAVDAAWFEEYTATTASPFVHALHAQGYHVVKDMPTMVRACIGQHFAGGLHPDLQKARTTDPPPYYDTHRYVDVYLMQPRVGKPVRGSTRRRRLYKVALKSFDHADVFPLKNKTIAAMTLPFPSHPERLLTKLYGDWRTVRQTLHGEV